MKEKVVCTNCNGCSKYCLYRSGDFCFADIIEDILSKDKVEDSSDELY